MWGKENIKIAAITLHGIFPGLTRWAVFLYLDSIGESSSHRQNLHSLAK